MLGPPVRGDLRRLGGFGEGLVEGLRGMLSSADQLGYAWQILREGVCAEADLAGHPLFCRRCLRELRLHTSPALLPGDLLEADRLRRMSAEDLVALGRVPFPFVREVGDPGFTRVSWESALSRIGEVLRAIPAQRQAWLGTEALSDEAAYSLGRTARLLGGHGVHIVVDHPGRAVLAAMLGHASGTGTLEDLDSDVVLVWGANLRENHPAVYARLREAKLRGTRVVSIDVLDGLPLADDLVRVRPGGDGALAAAVLATLDGWGALDEVGIEAHTSGLLELDSVEDLTTISGARPELVEWLATLLVRSASSCSVFGRGLGAGVAGVAALHLATGRLASAGSALLPLWSPGPWDMGLAPDRLPGRALTARSAARLSRILGVPIPAAGNPAPEPDFVYTVGARASGRIRVHQLVHIDPSVVEPGELVVLLPSCRPHEEQRTRTTLERRRVHHEPLFGGPSAGEARPSWEIPDLVGRAASPGLPALELAEMGRVLGPDRWERHLHRDGDFSRLPGCRARFVPIPKPVLRPGVHLSLRHGVARGLIFVSRSSGFEDGDHVRVLGDLGSIPARIRLADLLPSVAQLDASDSARVTSDGRVRIERA